MGQSVAGGRARVNRDTAVAAGVGGFESRHPATGQLRKFIAVGHAVGVVCGPARRSDPAVYAFYAFYALEPAIDRFSEEGETLIDSR
jgi:hypothetical protein